MFNQIIFEDEITLYWDKQEFSENAVAYKVYVNGEEHGVTAKTHYTCAGLKPATWYTVRVETLEQGRLSTAKRCWAKRIGICAR